ncbi:MAG TPA: MSMEG_0567/Sll0786 family nitrogen starvation N-acetyltransferase [Polyangiaceae bacterium]|nr:MSMEG_0567/Sll0786 family nitrogen starvation N-acetyltransferase [Polyangiaceae bacterium]
MASREFEPCQPWGSPGRFLSRAISAEVAGERWQVDAYYRLRREIFEREQGLFTGSDVDEHDAHATPIVALNHVAGMPHEVIGVVRIYRSGGDTWYGGRLGVAHDYRRVGAVGGALIHTAVETAHAHGCRRFLATVQQRNVRYFEHYDFYPLGELTLRGQPHQLMQADLRCFPPCPKALAALAHGLPARAA